MMWDTFAEKAFAKLELPLAEADTPAGGIPAAAADDTDPAGDPGAAPEGPAADPDGSAAPSAGVPAMFKRGRGRKKKRW
ncbi:MAG TPA: hypothetical protein PKM88_15135 [bacterium]|nr:hypothetical protein [bacterium]